MNNLTKNLVLWLVIAMVLMAVFNNFAPEQNRAGQEIDYSVFLDEVERRSLSTGPRFTSGAATVRDMSPIHLAIPAWLTTFSKPIS
jgi:hypothetical protein